jgi:hypothetical protein
MSWKHHASSDKIHSVHSILRIRFDRAVTIGLIGLLWLSPVFLFAREPDDEHYDEQWYLGQVDAPEAWDEVTGSSKIIIAVLDTGVSLDHPDLAPNIWENNNEIADNGVDDDNNGFIDDEDPNPDASVDADPDAISHGTVIAGIIGAQGNNEEGISGVMWNLEIMAIRMLNKDGSGNSIDAAKAVDYAVENGADVINLSFSGDVDDPRLRSAIEDAYNAGVVVVAALGNEGKNIDNNPVYPACYKSGSEDWVIGVAATTKDDKKSTFSNFGKTCTDLSAPGEDMFSVDYYDPDDPDDPYIGGWAGTSVASPVVAGAAGLLLSAYPDLTPEEVRLSLELSVDPLNAPEFVNSLGAGRLNIEYALEVASNYSDQDEGEDEGEDSEEGELVVEEGEGTSPVTGEVQDVDNVYAGDYITSPSFATVYYVTTDGERRPFMDTNTFFTYEDSFDAVREVSDATLPELSFGQLMLPKEGVILVKIQSTPTVYALGENDDDAFAPALREIETEELAIDLYGANWADYVIDVQSTFFGKFGTGDSMEEGESVDRSLMKTRAELSALAQ